jgi:hypothetical protein
MATANRLPGHFLPTGKKEEAGFAAGLLQQTK